MTANDNPLKAPAKAFACKELTTGLILVRTITDSPVGAMVNWLYNHASIVCLATDTPKSIGDKFEAAAAGKAQVVPVMVMETSWQDPRKKKA